MTSNHFLAVRVCGALIFLTLLLTGCPQGGDSRSPGITVHFAESHSEAAEATHGSSALTANSTVPDSPTVHEPATQAGGEHGHDEPHKHAHDRNDVSVSIYVAYLVIDGIELQRCSSLSAAFSDFLGSVIGKAYAHAGGGSEPDPDSGRDLSEANVIDIMTADNVSLNLGSLSMSPGEYCGLQVSLVPAHDRAHGLPADVSLLGAAFYFETNYRNGDGSRTAVNFDSTGVSLPYSIFVPFHEPLVLDESRLAGFVTLNLAYDQWFHDIDVTRLGSDVAEREMLIGTILGSISADAHSE